VYSQVTITGIVGTSSQAILSYDAPVITQHAVPNVVLSGGSTVTLAGFNFGIEQASPTINLISSVNVDAAISSQVNCATTSWQTVTTVLCRTPGTAFVVGSNPLVSVTVAAMVGTSTGRFTYDGPALTQLTTLNSATSGATSVTITGLNFGFYDQTASSSLLTSGVNLYAVTTAWSSATSVSVSTPGVATGMLLGSGTVPLVNVNTIVGTGTLYLLTYDAPVLTYAVSAKQNNPTSGDDRVTISGLDFASADTTPTVFAAMTRCNSASWSSATSLRCFTPAGTGRNMPYGVAVLSIIGTARSTANLWVTYDTPVISSSRITSNSAATAGSVLTMFGLNFAVLDATVSAALGATVCTSATWTTGTSVACRPTIGGTGSQTLGVVVTGIVGTSRMPTNSIYFFTFDAPVATGVAAVNGAPSGFTPLTLSGVNFGYGLDATPTAALVGTGSVLGAVAATALPCASTSWTSVTALQCALSPAASPRSTPLYQVVTVGGIVGTAAAVTFTFDAPVPTSHTLQNGATTGGSTVTLSGLNFNIVDVTASAQIYALCATTSWTTRTAVACGLAEGYYDNNRPAVTVNTVVGSSSVLFTFDAPVVTQASTSNVAASASIYVTITGLNFGNTPDLSSTVRIGSTTAFTTSWASATSLVALPQNGIGSQNAYAVLGVQVATGANLFTFDVPVVSAVSRLNAPSSAGQSLTLNGMNFGFNDVSASAVVGGSSCLSVAWTTVTAVTCRTPTGVGTVAGISVTITGLVGTATFPAPWGYTYDAPVLSNFQLDNAPSSGGGSLTIDGTNFGVVDVTTSIRLGQFGTQCSTTVWFANTRVVCLGTPGVGRDHAVLLTVAALVGTSIHGVTYGAVAASFSYDAPVSTSLAPFNAGVSGGASVTLFGLGFASRDVTLTVAFANAAAADLCLTSTWSTASTVVCQGSALATAGASLAASPSLTVARVVGTAPYAFTFDAPSLTLSTRWNVPNTGGATVTVSGLNFGLSDFTPTVAVLSNNCATTAWTSSSAVSCQVVSATYGPAYLQTTLYSQVGTGASLLTFDSPVITTTSPGNAPFTGSATATLLGVNFVPTNTSPTATIGITACATTSWQAGTRVVCRGAAAHAGVAVLHSPRLIIGTSVGTGLVQLTYDAPVATFVSKVFNGPTSGGAQLTLLGTSFGIISATATVQIGSTSCSTTTWSTATAVLCLQPFGLSLGRQSTSPLSVTIAGVVGTLAGRFSYDTPVVTQASRPNGPTSGGFSLTLTGVNFAVSDATASTSLQPPLDCATSSWSTGTTVVCLVGSTQGYGSGLSVSLTVGAYAGSSATTFTFNAPAVTDLQLPNAPVLGASSVTIRGLNFAGLDRSPTLQMAAGYVVTASWTTDTTVVVMPNIGSGTEAPVLLVASLQGTSARFFTWDGPVLTNPRTLGNIPVSGSALATMHGLNFGYGDLSVSMTIGATRCATASWTTSTAVTCATPAGYGLVSDGLDTSNVIVSATIGTGASLFSFDGPFVTSLAARNAPTFSPQAGPAQITIAGLNLGGRDPSPSVTMGNTRCLSSFWTSSTAIVCSVSSGLGTRIAFPLTIANVVGTGMSSNAGIFSFDAPVVTDNQARNVPSTGLALITVNGLNFGAEFGSPTGMIGLTLCATTSWNSDSSLVCLVRQGWNSKSTTLFTSVSVAAVVGTLNQAFTYDAPVLTGLLQTVTNSPASGGASITVFGLNFGPIDISSTVFVAEVLCQTSVWVTDSSLKCAVGSGYDPSKVLKITVANRVGTLRSAFSYDAPVVSFTAVFNAPHSGRSSLTVMGLNFASLDTSPTVLIGPATACQTTSWLTDTQVQCSSAEGGWGSSVYMQALVSSLVGTMPAMFTYDGPAITRVVLTNAPTDTAASVSIMGVNFGYVDLSGSAVIGGTACITAIWSSTTHMQCLSAPGYGKSKDVIITLSQAVGTFNLVFSFDGPVIQLATPNSPVTGRSTATVTGINFARQDSTLSAMIGSTICGTSTWTTRTAVTCLVQVGLANNVLIGLTIGSVVGTTPTRPFSYDSPIVTSVAVANMPDSGGAVVSLSGVNFGAIDVTSSATISVTLCASTVWTSDSAVSCRTATGGVSGGYLDTYLAVAGSVGTLQGSFSFTRRASRI